MGQRGDGRTHCVLLQVVPPSALDQLLPQMLLEPDKKKKTWVRDASCTGSSSRGAACAREASARAYRSYSPLCSSFVWIEFFNSWVALMVLARAAAAAAQQRRRKANAPERGGLHAPCTAPFVVAKDVFSRSQSNGFETAEREKSLPKRLLASRDASRTSASTASPTGRPSKQPCSPF